MVSVTGIPVLVEKSSNSFLDLDIITP